ncbi:hypothetical protein JYU34_004447 [Plutella xylostella]|uniref:FLYWCH-type domain-containing protein n=1 Tax=Plutella xylostella TaxID=51655 RepID=A0ABQ7QY04_PLUXY|nr:hypothetical protein JYU34_004447 [Plutella xylostella]
MFPQPAEPVFTKTRRGTPVIQVGAYRFNLWAGSRGSRARWTCVKATTLHCKAILVTIDNEIVKTKPHNH